MESVIRRRADIDKLIKAAKEEAELRHKKIDTVDPVVRCANRLFPYLHEALIHEYARTALRVILNNHKTGLNNTQTTLLAHIH
jgi:hypothetical protein